MGDKYKKDKRIFLFFLVVFFGFCALFGAQKIKSYDIWWHLKTGEWIWQHKAVPLVDSFSYTFQGVKWIDFEWLFQAVIYPIYQLGGFEGLIIFKIIVILLTFVILFLTCREVDGRKIWLSIIILFVALQVARGRFMVRPQTISLFFLALYLYLITLYRGERITIRQLIFFFIPLQVLWVNFHGSFLLGIFLLGAYALGRFVPLAVKHHQNLKPVFRDKNLRELVLLCLLLCIVSLLNPYTYQAFLFPLQTAGSETLGGIAEWLPSTDIRFLGVFVIEPSMWFRILFLIGIISFVIRFDNLKSVEKVIIFTIFSYMAFKHTRFSGDFAIVAAPIIVSNFIHLQLPERKWRLVYLLPILIIIAFSVRDVRALIKEERLGFGVWKNYPETTVNFLKEHNIKGNIYNSYGHGGYLIWHLWPDVPVFIDGRTPTIYDDDFFWLYGLADRKKEIWEKVAQDYDIEIVLVKDARERGYASLFYWLDEDKDWRLVAFDDFSNLYMRKGAKFNKLIKKYGFRYLRPSDLSMDYAKEKKNDLTYLKALEKELEESCQRFPRDFYPFYYLGVYHQIYGTTKHFQMSAKALQRAIANRPDLPRGYYELGFTLMRLKRYDEAIKSLKHCIRLSSSFPVDVYYYLGTSLFYKDELDEAIKFLEIYKKKTGFGTRADAYKLLGRAYIKKYKFQRSLSCLKRVIYLEEATWETFLNMGVAYFGMDNLEKAEESFKQAMERKPEEMKIIYNLAVTYEKLHSFEQARNLFGKLAKMRPKNPEEKAWVEKAKKKIVKMTDEKEI